MIMGALDAEGTGRGGSGIHVQGQRRGARCIILNEITVVSSSSLHLKIDSMEFGRNRTGRSVRGVIREHESMIYEWVRSK